MSKGHWFGFLLVALFVGLASAAPKVELGLGHAVSQGASPQSDYVWMDLSRQFLGQAMDLKLRADQVDGTNGVSARTELGDTYVAPGKLKFLSLRGGLGYLFDAQNVAYWNVMPKITAKLPRGLQHLDLYGTVGIKYEDSFRSKFSLETLQYSIGLGRVIRGHAVELTAFAQRVTAEHVGLELSISL